MREDIIFKLQALQSIEPDKAWQESNKRKLMEKVPAFGLQNDVFLNSRDVFVGSTPFNLKTFIFKRVAVSLASIMVIMTSGVITVGASQSSLPGDPLYSVKRASEQVALAVASEADKPKVEIEQAGKRLEELAQVSQKSSDTEQHQKVEQLVSEFESKINSANERLNELNNKGKEDVAIKDKLAEAAKVVTEQSEKYSEVLTKTTESMPDSVKSKVAESVASAVESTEKTNIGALLVMVETNQTSEEDYEKIQKKIAKIEENIALVESVLMSENVCVEESSEENQEEETSAVEKEEKSVEVEEGSTAVREGENSENSSVEEQTEEESYCVSLSEIERREKMLLEAKNALVEAKKKFEEKDLVSAISVISPLREKVNKFVGGDFTAETPAEEDSEGEVKGDQVDVSETEEVQSGDVSEGDETVEEKTEENQEENTDLTEGQENGEKEGENVDEAVSSE